MSEYYDNTVYVEDDMLAPAGKRFANFLIDLGAFFLLNFIIGLLAGVLYLIGIEGLFIWITEMSEFENQLSSIVLFIFYYGLIETFTSRTLGKYITKTKVIMYDGSKPNARTILLRTVCRLIPFDHFSFLGSTARGWHDSLSKTYVIDVKKYEAAVQLKTSFNEIGKEEVF